MNASESKVPPHPAGSRPGRVKVSQSLRRARMRDREDKLGIDSQGANVAHIHPPRPGRQISSAIAITTTPSARFTPTQRRICASAAAPAGQSCPFTAAEKRL